MPPPKRVLIVDDQRPARQGLQALLSLRPEIVVVGQAVDGQEAVIMAAQCRPDVILMDVRMPDMDGLEATRLIKHNMPEVKVVVLTLHAEHQAEAAAAGADGFLIKGGPTEAFWDAILGP